MSLLDSAFLLLLQHLPTVRHLPSQSGGGRAGGGENEKIKHQIELLDVMMYQGFWPGVKQTPDWDGLIQAESIIT